MAFFGRRGIAALLVAVCVFALLALQSGVSSGHTSQNNEAISSSVVGLPGYDISVFAKGTTAYFNPDSVLVVGKYVYIGYQNAGVPDGSNGVPSTIVQYTFSGKFVRSWSIAGHCDGLRYDPYTKLIWATSNEDANPRLFTIDPAAGVVTSYTVPQHTMHGGGYDDLAFLNGMAFIAASNPLLNSSGVNTGPALEKITLSNGAAVITPVLYGNATATDIATGNKVTLNLTDPDSISVDLKGDLVLDSQGDGELVFLKNPGTSQQTVSRLLLGTQVDDSQWITDTDARLLIVDGKANTTYVVSHDGGFASGTAYTETPSDSGVAGFVGTIDLTTGTLKPVIIGLQSPTGLGLMPA